MNMCIDPHRAAALLSELDRFVSFVNLHKHVFPVLDNRIRDVRTVHSLERFSLAGYFERVSNEGE